ncbi:hypothetical protein N7532_000451 [Penicillium argentinense]|uniref:Uncharacterized protein n=1 Tax=Penicillium argentinense TaxID=1131581 RepID=A0A9W9G5C0_9EURO|nr:uncharacterized protein N7532_000451 [Penicillium argentinense]KAJ5112406.1 hypothetical protein N7532_000451 [Penicillium argentinense]
MTATPLVPHSVPEGAINGHLRYHPIAMNPNPPPHPQMPPPDQMHTPSSLEQIEARLRQLEHEEMTRMATRSHILAARKREDEDFRRLTESAEAEEEDLRRERKRIKRESMGLGPNAASDSPPMRPTPPRRLSETSAATTLAFFKQQSPPEPRQVPLPPQAPQAPQAPPAPQGSGPPPSMPPPAHLHPQPHPPHHAAPPPPPSLQHQSQHQSQLQHQIVPHDAINAAGSIRRKQKYTIKNVEAWGERHGRPAAHDPSGRALWKRPSDGSLVYLTCPIPGCGKSDFVTLHGFMCHLTKKHKDRTLGSQSRALELCGIVYDPNAPLPPVTASNRGSTEDSPSVPDRDGDAEDPEMDSESEEMDESQDEYRIKTEVTADSEGTHTPREVPSPLPKPTTNGSTKQSIHSIIDRTPETEPREALTSLPPSEPASQVPTPLPEQAVPAKRKFEYTPPASVSEKENTEPKEGSGPE